MIKRLLFVIICLMPIINFSQDYSNLWEGHFSYFNVKDISQGKR